MREIILDEENFHSAAEVHEFLASELNFPSYYGANLDALNDCLSDVAEECRITVSLSDEPESQDEFATWFPKLVRTLLRASRENEDLEVLVFLSNYASLGRLEACPGMAELLSSTAFSTQALISRSAL